LDHGAVIVIEEAEVAGVVIDIEVQSGAGVWWILIRVRIRHGIFAAVHEDAGVAHVRGCRVADAHAFDDALIFDMVWMLWTLWGGHDGGEGAKAGGDFRVF
jgi:hypothetical protein